MTLKELVLHAIGCCMGEDLERVEAAFRGMNDAELDQESGEGGRTPRQTLEGYRRDRREWEAAYWFADAHLPASDPPAARTKRK